VSVPVLIIALSAAVPRRIDQLKLRGGPTDEDRARVSEVSARLADKAHVLMHGGGEVGEAGALFDELVDALAVMAFAPGGISFLGTRWEA
jgi:hypothetical protein